MKVVILVLAALLISFRVMAFESGPGNGTDYRKILFSEAKSKLIQMLENENFENLYTSSLPAEYKAWLLLGESPKWPKLIYNLKNIELVYQEAPCVDDQGRTSSICFLLLNEKKYVLVSLSENTKTTSEQAMSMLVHEAGHFMGEMDHLFLNDLGVALVQFLLTPKIFIIEITDSEIVAVPFVAKKECETGESALAERLVKSAYQGLLNQCQKNYSLKACEQRAFQYVLKGQAEYIEGRGFTQKVICQIEANLR